MIITVLKWRLAPNQHPHQTYQYRPSNTYITPAATPTILNVSSPSVLLPTPHFQEETPLLPLQNLSHTLTTSFKSSNTLFEYNILGYQLQCIICPAQCLKIRAKFPNPTRKYEQPQTTTKNKYFFKPHYLLTLFPIVLILMTRGVNGRDELPRVMKYPVENVEIQTP